MIFDPNKPYAAKHGRPVRIISIDGTGSRPIAAWHTDVDGRREYLIEHYANGSSYINHDLYNVPERVTDEKFIGRLSSTGYVYLDLCRPNVRFTFEGDKLVAVELIGDE